MSYILVLNDFMINDKICIHLNYDVDFYNTSNEIISNNMMESLSKIIEEYSVETDGFIFLLDISGPSIFFFVPCSLSADLTRNPLKEFLSLDAFSNIAPTIGSAPIEGPPTIFKFCSII